MSDFDLNIDFGPDRTIDPQGIYHNLNDVVEQILDGDVSDEDTYSFFDFISEDAVAHAPTDVFPLTTGIDKEAHSTGFGQGQLITGPSTSIENAEGSASVGTPSFNSAPIRLQGFNIELETPSAPSTITPSVLTSGAPSPTPVYNQPSSGLPFSTPSNGYASPDLPPHETLQASSGPPVLVAAPNLPRNSPFRKKIAGCKCGNDIIMNGKSNGEYCTRCFNRVNREMAYAYQKELGENSTLPSTSYNGTDGHAVVQPASDEAGPSTQAIHYRPILPKYVGSAYAGAHVTQAPAYTSPNDVYDAEDQSPPEEDETGQGFGLVYPTNVEDMSSTIVTQEQHDGVLQLPTPKFTPPSDAFDTTYDGSEDAEATELDLEHASVEAAFSYIHRPPAAVCKQIRVEDDNWQELKGPKFTRMCSQLHQALSEPCDAPPDYFSPAERAYFTKNHGRTYKTVLSQVETGEQIKLAKARIILAMDGVVYLHETGVPKAVVKSQNARLHKGYPLDESLTAMKRAETLVDYARANKYIALDIINGANVGDLVRNPKMYLDRKWSNQQTNSGRADDMAAMKRLKKGETIDDLEGAGLLQPRKRGRKGKQASSLSVTAAPKRSRGPEDSGHQDDDHKASKRARFDGEEENDDDAIAGSGIDDSGFGTIGFSNIYGPSEVELYGREPTQEERHKA